MPKFIGIKQLWYGAPLVAAPTRATIATLISNSTEVLNIHQDTWGYSQDDPDVTDYINELTGRPYHRDKVDEGRKSIVFTMGEYDYATKAARQGGEVIMDGTTPVGWKSPTTPAFVNKSIIAKTKTGTYIIFTNASVIGKGDQQQKAVGLGVTAVAMENENSTDAVPTATPTAQTVGSAIEGTVYLEVAATASGAVRCALSDGTVIYLSGTASTGNAQSGKVYYAKDTTNTTIVPIADEYWFNEPE